jgi:hypothetical protein
MHVESLYENVLRGGQKSCEQFRGAVVDITEEPHCIAVYDFVVGAVVAGWGKAIKGHLKEFVATRFTARFL